MVDAPKRRWKRVKVDIRVRLRRWEEPEENSSVVRTYELSEGGMSVYASETLEIGTVLLVEMALARCAEAVAITSRGEEPARLPLRYGICGASRSVRDPRLCATWQPPRVWWIFWRFDPHSREQALRSNVLPGHVRCRPRELRGRG